MCLPPLSDWVEVRGLWGRKRAKEHIKVQWLYLDEFISNLHLQKFSLKICDNVRERKKTRQRWERATATAKVFLGTAFSRKYINYYLETHLYLET